MLGEFFMEKFDEIVEFLTTYSEDNCTMSASTFDQLKNMMSSFLELEDMCNQSEMILNRMFSQSKFAFLRAGLFIKSERNLIADLELIEELTCHVDKNHSDNQTKGKELSLQKDEFESLKKECSLLRSNCESLNTRCTYMNTELNINQEELKLYKKRSSDLEIELQRNRTSSSDSVEHFHSLYNATVLENMTINTRFSSEVLSLNTQKDILQREASSLRLESEEAKSLSQSNTQKLFLAESTLAKLTSEYKTVMDKYLKLTQEHDEEIKAYQQEIEEVSYKLLETKKSLKKQNSGSFSVDENGLDDQLFDDHFLTDGFKDDDMDRYSNGSSGLKFVNAGDEKNRRIDKMNSLFSPNQNTTITESSPSFNFPKGHELEREISCLKSKIENLVAVVDNKDQEIENLKDLVTVSRNQLSDIMNDATEEIIQKDKTIALLKRDLRFIEASTAY